MRDEQSGQATGHGADWSPTPEVLNASNIGWLMQHLNAASYQEVHHWSVNNRAAYWRLVLERLQISFRKPYQQIVDLSEGIERPKWLPGAELNIVESCFTAPPESTAIIYQSQGGELQQMSYGELAALTDRVALNIRRSGFQIGDALAILMPMTVESVAIYLGIIKSGCVAVSIADSFRAKEIATRLRISNAKAVFTQDVIVRGSKTLPLYANAVEANSPTAIVLPGVGSLSVPLRPGDMSWDQFLIADGTFDAESRRPHDVINILFSSGTTGDPKAIPWTQTTPLKCAADSHFHHDIQSTDVVVWPTNLGWMMGPWLIFASLMNKATMGLYYGPPTGREFGQFVANARTTVLGVIPSLVKTWKQADCLSGLDWGAIRLFSSTGECSSADDMRWLMQFAGGKPVIEYCGGTEIGGGYITSTLALPVNAATFSTPALGIDLVILNEDGQPADSGELFLIPPSIGMSDTLLNQDHHRVYFAETPIGPDGVVLRRHGDEMRQLETGGWQPLGRADDTMNLGGIKVSSAEIERALQPIPGIMETAAIAVSKGGGPSLLVIYAVCSPDVSHHHDTATLRTLMQSSISTELNPLFKIHDLILTDSLPRTASNKVMRRTLRDQYMNQI